MPYDTHHCVHRPALVVSLQGTPQSFQGIENGRRISVQDIELQISWREKNNTIDADVRLNFSRKWSET